MKSFLTNPDDYNFEFECECGLEDYIKLPSEERYLTYKATGADRDDESVYPPGGAFAASIQDNCQYRQLGDCDGSTKGCNIALIHDVYLKLWGWARKKGKTIFGSVENGKFGCEFGGDTMNSMQTVLNDITTQIITAHENLLNFQITAQAAYEKLHGKCMKEWKVGLNYLIALYADEGCNKELLYAFDTVKYLSEYTDTYHTLGNFALVPTGFNKKRVRMTKDYWDLSLQHLKEEGWEENFNCKGDGKDYIRYINYFFLWDYVSDNCSFADKLQKNYAQTAKNKQRLRGI